MKKIKISRNIACPTCGCIIRKRDYPGAKSIVICPRCNTKGSFQMPTRTNFRRRFNNYILSSLILAIVIVLSHYIFPENNGYIMASFLGVIPIFFLLKLEKRIIIIFATSLLGFTTIALSIYNDQLLANQLAIYIYWLLVAGVLCHLINYFKKLTLIFQKRIFG